jgi:Putative Ig domain/Abnormal spindle-like microcephaly-assoc'd, ASPM-SPD-2-Hydin
MSLKYFRVELNLALLLALMAIGVRAGSAQVTASPTNVNFGSVAVNVEGFAPRVTLTNSGSRSVSLTGITFGLPQYTVNTGLPVQTILAHTSVQFGFLFLASQPGNYNTSITFNFSLIPSVVIQTSATAIASTAVASLSTTSLNFGTVNFGSTGSQSVTVTNTAPPGSNSLTLAAIDIYYQPFAVTGPAAPVVLAPGNSATYQVTFSPLVAGSTVGSLTFCYTSLPCDAVDLAGTGALPTQLSLTNYPATPYATQGYPYQTNMTATGGTPPYVFRVLSGKLPAGLTMATTGAITGTVSSSVATGAYTFTAQVQDSSKPKRLTDTENITLNVDAPTGANCNITSVDVGGTSTPIVDLMDLGSGTYCPAGADCAECPFGGTCEGGLYPNGSNTDPDPHESDGAAIAQSIQPLNTSGDPDPTGKYVMISIGESASQQPFEQFITQAEADPDLNPNLVIVDGAEGGATANTWTSQTSAFWTELINYSLPFAGVTRQQVVAVWVSDVNSLQGATFPGDATQLQSNYETIANILVLPQFFPNIKMMLFSSMNYSGYSQGVDTTLPEPQAYESGFGPKWAIEDQINGNPNLNYNSADGPVLAPWMGWSFYYWGNGLIPRSDGITWSCQDLNSDGLHPADPWGHIKIAQYLLDWFKTSELTTPWFVNNSGTKK